MHRHSLSVQSCPHCAFSGASAQFVAVVQQPTSALAIKRRIPRQHAAVDVAIEPPQLSPAPRPPAMPSVNPSGWVVREYPPIPALPAVPAPVTPQRNPEPRTNAEMNWEAAQAYADSLNPRRPVTVPMTAPAEAPPPPPVPEPLQWNPMKPSAHPKLTAWPGIDAQLGASGSADDFIPKPKRSVVWPLIMIVTMIMAGVGTAIFLEQQRQKSASPAMVATSSRVEPDFPTIKAAIPVVAPIPLPPESKLSPLDAAAQVQGLLEKLFAATTPEARLACVADASHHKDEVTTFFAKQSSPIKVEFCRPFPATTFSIPGGHPTTLCEVGTSLAAPGTGIARLLSEADGSLRLDWPMLHDSLTGALFHFMESKPKEPMWVTIGARRNFGFDESETIRQQHLVFDIQGLGNGADRAILLASKNQPIGRSLDHLVSWNQLYLLRALVHFETLEGQPRLVILDADLISADTSRQ
jgi:hypothetical protein